METNHKYHKFISQLSERSLDVCCLVTIETWPRLLDWVVYLVDKDARTADVVKEANKTIGHNAIDRFRVVSDIVARSLNPTNRVKVTAQDQEEVFKILRKSGRMMVMLSRASVSKLTWEEMQERTKCAQLPTSRFPGGELSCHFDDRRVSNLVSIIVSDVKIPGPINRPTLRRVILWWIFALFKRYVPVVGVIVEESEKLGLFKEAVWRSLRGEYAPILSPDVAAMSREEVDKVVEISCFEVAGIGSPEPLELPVVVGARGVQKSACCLLM